MSGSQFFNRLRGILTYGIIIYAAVPSALGFLFLLSGYGIVTVPVLTAYYVVAIIGAALLAFERLSKELRTSPKA